MAAFGRGCGTGGALFYRAAHGGVREITLPGVQPDQVAFTTSRFGLIGTLGGRFFVTIDGRKDWDQAR